MALEPVRRPPNSNTGGEQAGVVQDVSAFRNGVINLTGGAFPEQLQSAQVSAGFFRLFDALVLRGRTFTQQEDLSGALAYGRILVHNQVEDIQV